MKDFKTFIFYVSFLKKQLESVFHFFKKYIFNKDNNLGYPTRERDNGNLRRNGL